MPRRIDVELTSARDDGTWTWRAAGARQPKGVLDASLLYEGARPGDVVRAEADFEIEGITITSVFPPKGKKAEPVERIQPTGPEREFEPVTSSLVPKGQGSRPGGRDRDRGPRGEGDRPRGPRREGSGAPTGAGTNRRGQPIRGAGGAGGAARGAGESSGSGRGRPAGAGAGAGGRRPDQGGRSEGRERTTAAPEDARPRSKKLNPGSAHRQAVLAAVQEEHRPIAEQVARGGLPAVRRAIEEQNATARAAGQPEIRTEALLAIAEELVPRLKGAEWRDRAEAAVADVDDISLRDLRSVVSSADAGARDEESRELAAKLRAALDRRAGAQRDQWLADVAKALEENRLVRALRVASRPPDPSVRLPAEVATRLADAASTAMAPDAPVDRWKTLLEAVADSPVRRSVKPTGLPEGAPEDLVAAAQQQAGRIPALAALLGIDMPPPPGPPRGAPKRPTRPGGGRPPAAGGRPIPPPPVQAALAASGAPAAPAEQPLTPPAGVTSSMDEGAETVATEGDPVSTGAPAPEEPSPEPAPPTDVGVEAAEAAVFSESGDQGATTDGSGTSDQSS